MGPILSGCRRPESPASTARQTDITVQDIDEAGFARLLEAHKGRVVLVDFWATWCLSCAELFPHTVDLHRRLADRGVTVVSISLDEPERREDVLAFLRRQQATFDNYLCRYGGTARSFEVFAIDGGALPHLKLYDRHGKLHRMFTSAGRNIELAEIDQAVEELLGAAGT